MSDEKRTEKVTKGKVEIDSSLSNRLVDDLDLEDNKVVAKYIFKELLIPKVKDLVYDILTGAIEKKMYRTSSGPSSRRRHSGNERVSYDTRYSRSNSSYRDRDSDDNPSENSDYRNTKFYERADAEDVLNTLCDIIEQYHQATIGDFWDALGKTQDDNFAKNAEYGWTNLNNAQVRRVHNYYILDMPRAKYLN